MKILFVCIGNTCRSPMAEAVMNYWLDYYNVDWDVDSAALRAWNIGRKPEERCLKVLEENGLTTKHYGRLIRDDDFNECDYILAMDEYNVNELTVLAELAGQESKAKIELLGSYINRSEDAIINDPYFSSGLGSFRSTFAQINAACRNFVRTHGKIDPLKVHRYNAKMFTSKPKDVLSLRQNVYKLNIKNPPPSKKQNSQMRRPMQNHQLTKTAI